MGLLLQRLPRVDQNGSRPMSPAEIAFYAWLAQSITVAAIIVAVFDLAEWPAA